MFNTKENEIYKGPSPDFKWLYLENRCEDDYKALTEWHDVCKKDPYYEFNMQRELVSYYKNEVLILTHAVVKLSNNIEEKQGYSNTF